MRAKCGVFFVEVNLVSGAHYFSNICNQYNTHIFDNDIAEIYQSAYKPTHSVETAIVCVHSASCPPWSKRSLWYGWQLQTAWGSKNVVGIPGTAVAWFASYSQGRTQKSVLTMNIHPRQNSSGVYHTGQYWAQFFLQHIYSHSMKFWGNWG